MEQPPLTLADLAGWVAALPRLHADAADAERVDRLRALEELKGAICAAQAREAVALKRSVIAAECAQGVPAERRGRGVGAQVALARRESPNRGDRLLGLAQALVTELPNTMELLTTGRIGEWRATLICRETACLSRADRRRVDAELAEGLAAMSDRQLVASARRAGYALDPHSVIERVARAESDRRVSLRPAPDCMAVLTALLPVAQGVAMFAALTRAADAARASGDERGRGQVMADTLVERATGQTQATQTPVEVQLVISDAALLGDTHDAAELLGYGPIPAEIARRLIDNLHPNTGLTLRRLYAQPDTRQLVAMESRRRLFPKPLRQLVATRDQYCRTPWCGAPIRHIDHVTPARTGGPTSASNGQGLCERCNQTKEAPGWNAEARPDGTITTTTPTGHRYRSTAPPQPRPAHSAVRADISFSVLPRAA